ncbi:MAG: hypothetical protein ACM33U_09165 [Solirubrobacterales bacterium]|nr:hypothetical protein [Solirubrobacterales bacterium]
MSVLSQVQKTLKATGCSDWRAELARKLARALDHEPNASMARELRALMGQIEASEESSGDRTVDDLRARRAARIARAAAQ